MRPFKPKNDGSTLIGVLFAIGISGFLGMALIHVSASENMTSVNEMQTEQALYVGHAGLEEARMLADYGQSPNGIQRNYGEGTYTITADLDTRQITVDSQVGPAVKQQTIFTNFSKNCVTLDTSTTYADAENLKNVKLVKTCNAAATVTKMWIDWNWPQCALQEGGGDETDCSFDYSSYEDPSNPNKIYICHAPSGDESKANTISVGIDDWESGGHSNHEADYLGQCGGGGPTSEEQEEWEDSCEDTASPDCDDTDHTSDHTHGGGLVEMIGLNGQTIYDSANGIGSPAPSGADPAVEIDVSDTTLTANGEYLFLGSSNPEHAIRFNKIIPSGGWYLIAVEFADGTQIYSIFTL